MKYLTLLLLIISQLLTANDVILKTDLINKQRQNNITALTKERDINNTNRLYILQKRNQKARLKLEDTRLKRSNHMASSNFKCDFYQN